MATKKKVIMMTAGEIVKALKTVPANDVPTFIDGRGNHFALRSIDIDRSNSCNTWQQEPNGNVRFYDSEGRYIFTVEAE